MDFNSRKALATGVAVAALMAASTALAQTAVPSVTEPEASSVDDIIVTAQRRSQRLQDVPVTVTVFGAEELEQARIKDVDDVATRTPGLQFDAFPASQPRIAIRGIGSTDRGAAGDPSSAVFLDEIYLGRPGMVAFDAFDIERIEVLKGPQGTLYGRNVVGGAINVVTQRPDLDAFGVSTETTIGNYGRLEGAAVLNAPFAEGRAAVRASGSWRTHDGYTENSFTGGEVDDQDTRSARIQIAAQPSDTVRLAFTIDGTRDRAAGPANRVLDLDDSDPLSMFWTVNRDRDSFAGSTDGFQNRDTWGVRAEAQFDLSFATLTYLGGYRNLDYSTAYDFDGGNPTTNFIQISGGNDEQTDATSHELRLSSLPDSPVQWVAGIYNYDSDVHRLDTLILDLGGEGTETYDQDAQLTSYAVFGDISVPVGDRLSLIGGLRYTDDQKDYRISNTSGDSIFRGEEAFDVSASASFDALTWRVGADYALADNHLLYVMVSRGFKSGGFQDIPATAEEAADPFDPEYATQFEIGQKSVFLDGRLVWNNTLYTIDYTDLQTRRTLPSGAVVTDNAGAATITGYETYLSWRPFGGARIVAGYGYTDATFDDYFVDDTTNYAGNRIARAPEHKLVLSPSYDWDLAGGATIRAAVDYRYESLIYEDNSNTGPERREPTNIYDARIIYTDASARWSVSLWGKNLGDEVTRSFQGAFLGANFGAYAPPRTYGLSLNWTL
ncbi:TonB-dependent receptor [Brevundimonas sp.]|uniref:TonB-dependent receptor n=1 Tax=Brevundimonas sp. TaxID=1871086 RepID=UPI002ABC71EB|nr:TonB-dependent receptor [Brevundimonas sp.]MDZ4361875.1 TonB-dependent receptor [Brevundimonas sp.]